MADAAPQKKKQGTPSAVGQALLQNLLANLEKKGTLTIEDIGGILSATSNSLSGDSLEMDVLKREIEKMAEHIARAKKEIVSMVLVPKGDEKEEESSHHAIAQLGEVVKHTELATNRIMDAADQITNLTMEVADEATQQKISDQTMEIYDACSFQDISGQRINKVIEMVEDTERRVVALVKLFNGELPDDYVPPAEKQKVERPDEELMSGPQLASERPTQDDIDALFND